MCVSRATATVGLANRPDEPLDRQLGDEQRHLPPVSNSDAFDAGGLLLHVGVWSRLADALALPPAR